VARSKNRRLRVHSLGLGRLKLGVNHEGLVFQAAAVTDSPNAFPARGPWVTARTSASVIGMSGAMFFSTPSLV